MARLLQLLLSTSAALAVLGLLAAPHARAHQLQVLDPGSGEVDVGTSELARLVHGALVEVDDELVVTFEGTAAAVEAVLLVPDQEPERNLDDAAAPTMRIDANAAEGLPKAAARGDVVVDEATGITYREVAAMPIEMGYAARVVVSRGSEPARVALRIGPPTTFATDDLESTPQAALEARLWAENPIPGTGPGGGERTGDAEPRTDYAWYGAGIALVAVLVAAWWIWRGRAASRRRGVERARGRDR